MSWRRTHCLTHTKSCATLARFLSARTCITLGLQASKCLSCGQMVRVTSQKSLKVPLSTSIVAEHGDTLPCIFLFVYACMHIHLYVSIHAVCQRPARFVRMLSTDVSGFKSSATEWLINQVFDSSNRAANCSYLLASLTRVADPR